MSNAHGPQELSDPHLSERNRRGVFRMVVQGMAAGGVAGALHGRSLLRTEAAAVRRRRYGVFSADTSAAKRLWRTTGGTHVSVMAYWDRLQSAAGGALSETALADLRAQIAAAASAGLQVILTCALHYPPPFVQAAVAPFRNQTGDPFTASQPSGLNVRDWIWTLTGRTYAGDFIARTLAALDLSKIAAIRVGGGYYGELHFPPTGNVSSPPWFWGFGAAPQSGVDLAPDQAVCPLPGYVPFAAAGAASADAEWVQWYLGSLQQFLLWQIRTYRAAGWGGEQYILHPGFGLRTNWSPSSLVYHHAVAAGEDPARMIDTYKTIDGVWPWCTWLDQVDPAPTITVDSDKAAWRKLYDEARARGKHERIWGENTGGGDDANMDRVFANAISYGYTGVVWLDWPSLVAGTAGTLQNMGRNIKVFR